VERISVETADDMLDVLRSKVQRAELLVMAAAVSDFKSASRVEGKTARTGNLKVELESTTDILMELDSSIQDMCPVLAFSLEFGPEGEERAIRKMRRKGAAAIFCNPGDIPGTGMEAPYNQGRLMFENGTSIEIPRWSKRYIAELLIAAMGRYMMKGN